MERYLSLGLIAVNNRNFLQVKDFILLVKAFAKRHKVPQVTCTPTYIPAIILRGSVFQIIR